MALTLLLRNAGKLNGAGLVRRAQITPLKTFTTVVAGQQRSAVTTALAAKPICLVQTTKPLLRGITLSASRLSGVSGNHATMWKAERVLAASLLAIFPAAFLAPSQVADTLLAVAMVLHAHWGVEAIVVDYVRPALLGNVVPKIAHVSLFVFSIAALAGLLNLVYNDIGLVQAIKKFWAVREKEAEPVPLKGKK